MFPSHQGNEFEEFLLQISSSSNQQNTISQDLNHLLLGQANPCDNNIIIGKITNTSSLIPKISQPRPFLDTVNIDGLGHAKRIMHRDVERKRRHEMTTLHMSLRNLLPLEYVKGKRSISDYMQEAVNYIKYLRKKIKELGLKRDELKKLSNLSNPCLRNENPTMCTVRISSCLVGIEVLVNTDVNEQVLPLSRALKLLVKEGFNVVSCISTRVNDRLIHAIQCEVDDVDCINISELRSKLTEGIYPSLE